MPKLTELEGTFLKRHDDRSHSMVGDRLEGADGVQFLCPLCWKANGGPVGTHVVICWFVGRVPDSETPGPGRWTPSGKGLADLTFVPGNPPRSVSVALLSGCRWHGHVRGGIAE